MPSRWQGSGLDAAGLFRPRIKEPRTGFAKTAQWLGNQDVRFWRGSDPGSDPCSDPGSDPCSADPVPGAGLRHL